MSTSMKRWQLPSQRPSLLPRLLPVARLTLRLLQKKQRLKKKRKTTPLRSKASDPSSVEAARQTRTKLRPPLSGGYQVVLTPAALIGRMPRNRLTPSASGLHDINAKSMREADARSLK
jgi:hypothetical protein